MFRLFCEEKKNVKKCDRNKIMIDLSNKMKTEIEEGMRREKRVCPQQY